MLALSCRYTIIAWCHDGNGVMMGTIIFQNFADERATSYTAY